MEISEIHNVDNHSSKVIRMNGLSLLLLMIMALRVALFASETISEFKTISFHHGLHDNAYGDGNASSAGNAGRFYSDTTNVVDHPEFGTVKVDNAVIERTEYTWIPPRNPGWGITLLEADVLVVAGGGSGGRGFNYVPGGGGGGGEVVYRTGITLPPGGGTVFVGNGGQGTQLEGSTNGSDSRFLTQVAVGGGRGGVGIDAGCHGDSGGSGGGSSRSCQPGGDSLASMGLGNRGGYSVGTVHAGAGGAGGGGATKPGQSTVAATGNMGGNGGQGLSVGISGSSGIYGSGGGGGQRLQRDGYGGTNAGNGGGPGKNGRAHFGGGGGGGLSMDGTTLHSGGNGGSGIVIVRFQITSVPCAPGTYEVGNECVECPMNYYSGTGWTACLPNSDVAYQIGCADGEREWFKSKEEHPLIAGCSGAFQRFGIKKSSTEMNEDVTCARQAGDDGPWMSGENCSPADLCAEGWHVCSDAMEVYYHSGTGDCDVDSHVQPSVSLFFATGQSSNGAQMCTDDGLNDIYGCGSHAWIAASQGSQCGPLNALMSTVSQSSGSWLFSSSLDEARSVQKMNSQFGGVLCCRNSSCFNCSGSDNVCQKTLSGCSDGTREYFRNVEEFPNIAGCAGHFDIAGLIDEDGKPKGPSCNRESGNDIPQIPLHPCSASDLCEPGWKICDSTDLMLISSGGRFCDSSGHLDVPVGSFFAAAVETSLNSARCSDSVSLQGGIVGCGNLNRGSYCSADFNQGVFDSLLHSNCSNLSEWNCQTGSTLNPLLLITKNLSDRGGVLCCREKDAVCETCGASSGRSCVDSGSPEIFSLYPSSGPTSGATLISLSGRNFGSFGEVRFEYERPGPSGVVIFESESCNYQVPSGFYSNTKVICLVPSSAGGNARVTIRNDRQQVYTHPLVFKYDPPVIFSVSASDGFFPTTYWRS